MTKGITMTSIVGWITAFALIVAIGVPALSVASANSDTKIETTLSSAGVASGKAKFEKRMDDPVRLRLSVEVEDVASSGPLTVEVNGVEVGSITLVDGFGDLNLDSQVGDAPGDEGDDVPDMEAGDTVEVSNAAGTVIMSGTF